MVKINPNPSVIINFFIFAIFEFLFGNLITKSVPNQIIIYISLLFNIL